MTRTRVLLAWEYGGARGHIAKLRFVAESLGDGSSFVAALNSLDYAQELRSVCDEIIPGPRLGVKREVAGPLLRTGTVADSLPKTGFLDSERTRDGIEWWRTVIRDRHIDIVVAECAPRAVLAARTLGVPCAVVGNGYFVPPGTLTAFEGPPEFEAGNAVAERALIASVNVALRAIGAEGIARLPEIFAGDIDIPLTLPPLDPYRDVRSSAAVPPAEYVPDTPGTRGDKVTAYLSGRERRDKQVLGALRSLPVPVRCIAPGLSDMAVELLATDTMEVIPRAIPQAELHDGTRLLLHSGNHGTLCLGILAGLPQFALPRHKEQAYHAGRAAELGVLKTMREPEMSAESIAEGIMRAYEDSHLSSRAAEFAVEVRTYIQRDPQQALRDRLLPLM